MYCQLFFGLRYRTVSDAGQWPLRPPPPRAPRPGRWQSQAAENGRRISERRQPAAAAGERPAAPSRRSPAGPAVPRAGPRSPHSRRRSPRLRRRSPRLPCRSPLSPSPPAATLRRSCRRSVLPASAAPRRLPHGPGAGPGLQMRAGSARPVAAARRRSRWPTGSTRCPGRGPAATVARQSGKVRNLFLRCPTNSAGGRKIK